MFGQRAARQKRVAERRVDAVKIGRSNEYPHRLSLYSTPPLSEITIDEFESWAIDRLRVLTEVEAMQARGETEASSALRKVIDKHLPLSPNNSTRDISEERRKDHYSHYILRLLFCRSPDLRARFVRMEKGLFKLRFNSDDLEDRDQFLKSLDFGWQTVPANEVAQLQPEISWSEKDKVGGEFIKLDFTQVPDLVQRRQVFIREGYAYVPVSLQKELVFDEFAKRLLTALEATARALPRLDEDDRIHPLLKYLEEEGLPSSNDGMIRSAGDFKAEDVDSLAKSHFPLCMRHMHLTSRAGNHAKYDVRTQYGAFLRGIGLNVEEAVKLWRSIFKNKGEDEFNKQYLYNIRHLYGLEGSRKPTNAPNCVQLGKSTSPGEHGCPFSKFAPERLLESLKSMGITDVQEQADIKDKLKNSHYHLACTRVYELTHPNDNRDNVSITSPVQYFTQSYGLTKEAQ